MALAANSCQFSLKLFQQRMTVYSRCSFKLLAECTVWGLCPWGADGQGKGTHRMVLSADTLHCKRCLLHRQMYCLGQETLLGGLDFTVPDCSVLQSNLAIISYSSVNCDHGLMAHQFSTEDPSSVPSTHVKTLLTACTSSFRGPDGLIWCARTHRTKKYDGTNHLTTYLMFWYFKNQYSQK